MTAERKKKTADQALANAEAVAAQEAIEAGKAEEASAETVRAEHVDLRQAGAARVEADQVSITQSGASRIDAREVTISQSGAGIVRTEQIRFGEGASAFAVVAGRAEMAPGSQVFMLLARETNGDVRPILDWRGALALVAGLLLLRRLLGFLRAR